MLLASVFLLGGCGWVGGDLQDLGDAGPYDPLDVNEGDGDGDNGGFDHESPDAMVPGPEHGDSGFDTAPASGGPIDLGEIEICIDDVCSIDVERCPDNPDKSEPSICGCAEDDDADGDEDREPD